MSVTLTYNSVGKGLEVDGVEVLYVYGADFGPDRPSIPSWDTSYEVSYPTSVFDLGGFQPGHEVGLAAYNLENDGTTSVSGTLYLDFQRNDNGTRTTADNVSWNVTIPSGATNAGAYYFGVDVDEVWKGYSSYRLKRRGLVGGDAIGPEYTYFTVSNLNIDDTLYQSGCLWVNGRHLYYIDGAGDDWGNYGLGYKHKVAYDSNKYDYVGREYAGSIWIGTDGYIHYVTESGYKTRVYGYNHWFGGYTNVGSNKKGSMRVPNYQGYGHLCYVMNNGAKVRVLNGPPAGYV